MAKVSGEMQANFDILGHRIGALEVNMKCVRDRVERIENMLNSAAHEFASEQQQHNNASNFSNLSNGDNTPQSISGNRKVKMESKPAMGNLLDEDEVSDDGQYPPTGQPQIIPRPMEQRVRKDRNPRPRAVVITCPKNRNIVLLGGDENYRMPLPTYLDAIRHAKRPTATYMVTALLRRFLPPTTLARLCVNERQLANTAGGQMVDLDLLEVLKKQGHMQFPNTTVADKELMLRIEDVTRDVRRKIKVSKF